MSKKGKSDWNAVGVIYPGVVRVARQLRIKRRKALFMIGAATYEAVVILHHREPWPPEGADNEIGSYLEKLRMQGKEIEKNAVLFTLAERLTQKVCWKRRDSYCNGLEPLRCFLLGWKTAEEDAGK
jgi:hypothetical protein